jgi:branched-chain amino acid transport system ATP-binding protein
MAKVLEVRNLSKAFGGVQAVDRVSFDLNAGQLLALIGPNGAGKSTCFNLVNGQLSADGGSVSILGRRTDGLRPRDVWQLGVGRTFQITSTFASMTVLENVQMALLSFHGRTRSLIRTVNKMYVEESMELLELVGIGGQARKSCGVLAYGDLKRVELAVALANRPQLLLMDEPTAGMGTAERSRLMALTTEIVRTRQIGALFTEHDMEVVFGNADRIIVLNRGVLVAQGSPEEVRANREVQKIYLGSMVDKRV